MLINLVLPGDPHCISLAVSPVCLGAATCVGVHRSRAAVLTSQRGSGCLVTVPVWQISVQSVTVQVWQSLSQCGSHCPSVADLCSVSHCPNVAVTVPVWQIYVQLVTVPVWQSLSQCGSNCSSVADLCSVTVPVWQICVQSLSQCGRSVFGQLLSQCGSSMFSQSLSQCGRALFSQSLSQCGRCMWTAGSLGQTLSYTRVLLTSIIPVYY